ncbi:Kelch-type beta propeller [Penicillium atrosanguineum]|nr:Kelch-type beta propeller [Penicillium atrosanguineum]
MTVPTPPTKLTGHCSVIYGNTLYAYSPDGFLSIPLQKNGNWTTLESAKANVTGAACVTGAIDGNDDEEGLYVIGGTGASSGYSGLQRYSFANKTWTMLQSSTTSLTNRLYHGAAYIKSNTTLLVYGGSVDSKAASSSTFTISTSPPYDVVSQTDNGAPAALSPMLLPWSDSEVALVGGSTATAIYTYRMSGGWVNSGASLSDAVPSDIHCALVESENSKILKSFDMSVSPNTVTSYALVKDGTTESPAGQVGVASTKRSSSDYPTYNSTFAPTTTRSNYALAQGDDLVVISSGKGDDSLAIFNSTSNGWVNATELFYGSGTQHVLKATTTTSTTSTTPTATSSSTATSHTATSTPAAGVALARTTRSSLCLWIGFDFTPYSISAQAREAEERAERPRKGGDNKDRLSFQDRGIEPLANGAYPMARSPVPVASMSNDSLAIMSGRATGEKGLMPPSANMGYGLAKGKSSPLSTIPSSGLAPSSVYSEDHRPWQPTRRPDHRRRMGKYFQDGNATNLAGMQSDRSTVSSIYTKSDYRGSAWPMSNLAPLNFGFLDRPQPLGRVYSGSPTTAIPSSNHSLVIPEGQSARISSASSLSMDSEDDPHDTNWAGAGQNSWLGRPPSSNYTTSFYNTSTNDIPSQGARQPGNNRRSSVIIPEDINELPIQGQKENVNADMSWLNLQAGR